MKILFPSQQPHQEPSRSNIVLLLLVLFSFCVLLVSGDEPTCSWTSNERDPALKEMTYDVGNGPQSFWAYVEPEMSTFYKDSMMIKR